MEEPYIHIEKVGGQTVWRGAPTCAVGHRIPKPWGGLDDGVFAGWSWDGTVLRAWNDRYGIRPLFYVSRGEEIALSPSILRLLPQDAPAELNYAVYGLGFVVAGPLTDSVGPRWVFGGVAVVLAFASLVAYTLARSAERSAERPAEAEAA